MQMAPNESDPRAQSRQPQVAAEVNSEDHKSERSWMEDAMVTINNHLQAFRMLPWVMGGVGALLIVRYSGLFTRYQRAADIPSHLITRGATIRGVAVGVWPDSRLDVWHTPLGNRWLKWRQTPKPTCSDQLLSVTLAAITIAQPHTTHSWMRSNLIGHSLKLQMLHYSSTTDSLHCIVRYRKGYFRSLSCVNTELLSLGLATLEESPPGCHGTDDPHDKELIAFLSAGVRAEGSAQRRGEGVWRGSVHEARWRKVARFLRLKN